MLILLVRIVFVLLSITVGYTSGRAFYNDWMGSSVPPWFGGAMGFGVAVTLIAAERGFRRHFTRSLVAFLIGLAAGLVLSVLILAVMSFAIQDVDLRNTLDIPVALVTTYLVLVTVLRNADRFRVVVPFVEFRNDGITEGSRVLDRSALTDGRLLGLLRAGLIDQRLFVPRSLLVALESEAASNEAGMSARAQRALETLSELRNAIEDRLIIDETEIPNATTIGDVVLGLARLEGARVITADGDLAERARAEGIRVLDLSDLAESLAVILRPGENLLVTIEKPGEAEGQGVGYLDDGSMVVVTGGGEQVGARVNCTVLRTHKTANGRMVFAEIQPLTNHQATPRPE